MKSGDMKQPRKRARHEAQGKDQTLLSFMKERGEKVRMGGWTDVEHCVFVQTLKHIEEAKLTATPSAMSNIYNSVVKLVWNSADLRSICLAEKSEKEVTAKYAQPCKEAALINSLLQSSKDN